MAYTCPRNHGPLRWHDYQAKGRWFCRTCKGVLAFERTLKRFSSYSAFRSALTPDSAATKIRCPACAEQMTSFRIQNSARPYQIDRCERCASFWFDPGELKLITGSTSEQGTASLVFDKGSDPYVDLAHALVGHMNEVETKREQIFKMIAVVCIVLNIIVLIGLIPKAHTFAQIRGYKSTNPIGESIVSLLAFGAYYFRPWPLLALVGGLSLFKAFFILLAFI